MNKKISSLTILCFFILQGYAQKISSDTAIIVATNFISQKENKRNFTFNTIQKEVLNDTCLLYQVSFKEGGWVLLSADQKCKPILGYSITGDITDNSEKPPAFLFLLSSYKEEIIRLKRQNITSDTNINKWDLLYNNFQIADEKTNQKNEVLIDAVRDTKSFSYTIGELLLAGGSNPDYEPQWGQGRCNESYCSSCSVHYNQLIESCSGNDNCTCSHYNAGCGAVAFGQILWYWQYPNKVSDSFYDWSIIPHYIEGSTSLIEATHLASLLLEIGANDVINMHYWSGGSWTLVGAVEDGFHNIGYNATVKDRSYFNNSEWTQLLKDEINAGRPIFYKGENALLDFQHKHFWIIDGYDTGDYFHINWGWKGSTNGFFSIVDIDPNPYDDWDFNARNSAIVYISPDCAELPVQIDSYENESISSTIVHLMAQSQISIPAQGYSLEVINGGRLALTAGESVVLNPGFSVELGSSFIVKISECGSSRY